MKISEIVKVLDATVLSGEEHLDKEVFKCGASDLMSDILIAMSEGCVFLTGLTTVQVIRTAIISAVSTVVFVRGKIPPPEVIAMASKEGIPLLSTPYSMFVSCGRLYASEITGLTGIR